MSLCFVLVGVFHQSLYRKMQAPGKLNQRTICDVLQFVQQLGRISVLVPLSETEVSVCLPEKMTVEWDRPASKRQSAVGRTTLLSLLAQHSSDVQRYAK